MWLTFRYVFILITTNNIKSINNVYKEDPEIAVHLEKELQRQREKIELIASENFTSLAVMEAQGTWLTNKYAEGLPHKRYYGGCEHVDEVEILAIERAKKLFNAEHVNVQPHSGAQANVAVFTAFLNPGDTIMGMNLSHGGHLTHGSPVNFSGKFYKVVPYGVDRETERINYEELEAMAVENKPKLIIAGASAYSRIIDFERMADIAKKSGSLFFVDMAHIAGLVAAGLHPNPVEYADIVSTTTHKTLKGPRGGMILCKEEYQKAIDKSVFPGNQGGPLMHVIAAKAIALKEALSEDFTIYQKQVVSNAKIMAESFVKQGHRLVSGGTDNHLVLVNVSEKGITGKVAEEALDAVGITVNKNTIPFDTESPFVTSGIRIGTPAVTSRGMKEKDMDTIASLITTVLDNINNRKIQKQVAEDVKNLSLQFPLYTELDS